MFERILKILLKYKPIVRREVGRPEQDEKKHASTGLILGVCKDNNRTHGYNFSVLPNK